MVQKIKNKTKICIISAPHPEESGGIGIYVKHLIGFLSKIKENEITLVYRGEKDRKYKKENINYVEIKVPLPRKAPYSIVRERIFNERVKNFLDSNYFDIINSHATWGYWMKKYKKKENQKIIHTYHGITYDFFKIHLQKFKGLKKKLFASSLKYARQIEKPPIMKADKIICVSEKVKNRLEELYQIRKEMYIIRTGVDLKEFKTRNKEKIKKQLKLKQNKKYCLYLGGGSGWNKGLDRTIKLSREIYNLNKDYKLIVIGPEYSRVKEILNEPFIVYRGKVPRKDIPLYYNCSEIVFCLSRYEGGAPIMVVSEAMASGAVVACSKSSKQEILFDKENALILDEFYKKDAEKVNLILKNKKAKDKINKNSKITLKELSLEKWAKKYLDVLEIKK
jgi:glycosyltransferase involved in cell wall biosynthesis